MRLKPIQGCVLTSIVPSWQERGGIIVANHGPGRETMERRRIEACREGDGFEVGDIVMVCSLVGRDFFHEGRTLQSVPIQHVEVMLET